MTLATLISSCKDNESFILESSGYRIVAVANCIDNQLISVHFDYYLTRQTHWGRIVPIKKAFSLSLTPEMCLTTKKFTELRSKNWVKA